jgi:hypothetical protein
MRMNCSRSMTVSSSSSRAASACDERSTCSGHGPVAADCLHSRGRGGLDGGGRGRALTGPMHELKCMRIPHGKT